MDNKRVIKKEIIRSIVQAIEIIDGAYGMTEGLRQSNKYIEFTDNIKDKIEEKTGIHIDRYHEQHAIGKVVNLNDPEVKKLVSKYESFSKKIEEIEKKEKEDEKKEKRKKIMGNITAFFFVLLVYFLVFQFIKLLLVS